MDTNTRTNEFDLKTCLQKTDIKGYGFIDYESARKKRMELTKKSINEANSQINKLKRLGYKVGTSTVVLTINEQPITYRQFKRLRKRM